MLKYPFRISSWMAQSVRWIAVWMKSMAFWCALMESLMRWGCSGGCCAGCASGSVAVVGVAMTLVTLDVLAFFGFVVCFGLGVCVGSVMA